MLRCNIEPYELKFAFKARTSRETLRTKQTYFISIYEESCPEIRGMGEVAVFPSLQPSFTSFPDFEKRLKCVADEVTRFYEGEDLPLNSAIRFGFETAFADFRNGGNKSIVDKDSLKAIAGGIPINGLVWIDDPDAMLRQINKKISDGYTCIKLKIGANPFYEELRVLETIRSSFTSEMIQIRLDANGAFTEKNVFSRLDDLARFDIHSIEQPLPRNNRLTPDVCRTSPIPVALDEEMIERWYSPERMLDFLEEMRPGFIVLKPSLAGGFEMTRQWIEAAKSAGIGWWLTSALESNIGLCALAQFLSLYPGNLNIAHGLGTGEIYTNNLSSPIHRQGPYIFLDFE